MWVAAGDPSALDLVQYGALGVVVLGFVTGWIWARPAVLKLIKDLDEARADLRRLEHLDREVLLPALAKSTELIQRFLDEQKRWLDRLDREDRGGNPPPRPSR